MKFLNRIALVITPKQPMADWIATVDDTPPTLIELQQEASSYLLDEPTQEQPLDLLLNQLIAEHYQAIAQNEFTVWDEYLDHAPAQFDHAQFMLWFDVKLSGLTFDLAKQQLMSADVDET